MRAKLPAPILGHFDRQKSRDKLGIAPVRGGVCERAAAELPFLGASGGAPPPSKMISPCVITAEPISICLPMRWLCCQQGGA